MHRAEGRGGRSNTGVVAATGVDEHLMVKGSRGAGEETAQEVAAEQHLALAIEQSETATGKMRAYIA